MNIYTKGWNIDGSYGFQRSYLPSVFRPQYISKSIFLIWATFFGIILIGTLVSKISCFGVIFCFVFGFVFFEGGYKLDAIIWMKWDEIFLIFTIFFGIVLIGALVSKIICFGVYFCFGLFFFVKNDFIFPCLFGCDPNFFFLTFSCT